MLDTPSKWSFQGVQVATPPAKARAFVYVVSEPATGRHYVGRKNLFRKVTRPPLKGKTRKRRSEAESNWRKYPTSNPRISAAVKEGREDDFVWRIVAWCEDENEAKYIELHQIMMQNALLDDRWDNRLIHIRMSSDHLAALVKAFNQREGA